MARKEIINFRGLRTNGVNTTFRVGAGGDNGRADVMLIQALFRYIYNLGVHTVKVNSGLTKYDIPRITERCDETTQRAIWKFQQANARKLLSVDGRIHPASYENRVIDSEFSDYFYKKAAPPVMTITLLHIYASFAHPSTDEYISGLIAIAPDLKSWLT